MKKTIFCAFTMGFAIAAQAVAVQWNTGFLYTPDLSQEGVTYTKTYIGEDADYFYYLYTANFSSVMITSDATAVATFTKTSDGTFITTSNATGFTVADLLAGTTPNLPAFAANQPAGTYKADMLITSVLSTLTKHGARIL